MIPKTIHYCWFGRGEKSKLIKRCIASWKRVCPDYEIIEWNEDNYDISKADFMKRAYEAKNWAYVTDYARLDIVYEHGGIYLDTDVELIKPFDFLLKYAGFAGFEDSERVNTGVGFGAEKGNGIVGKMLAEYEGQDYLRADNTLNEACPIKNTRAAVSSGFRADGTFQTVNSFVLLPKDYFCPLENSTGVLTKTENTVAVHWFDKSWIDKKTKLRSKITRPFHRLFGEDCFERFKGKK